MIIPPSLARSRHTSFPGVPPVGVPLSEEGVFDLFVIPQADALRAVPRDSECAERDRTAETISPAEANTTLTIHGVAGYAGNVNP